MDPILLNQLAQLRAQGLRAPGVPKSELLEMLKLRREGTLARQGSQAALERLKALGAEERGVYGEVQTELRDSPSYKRPQREGVSKGTQAFGIGLGVLGALAGVRDPENLTGTVIGGQRAIKEQEYEDAMGALRERMEMDRQAKLDRVAGLQAKIGGIGSEKDIAALEQSVKSGEATRIGSELFQKEQFYQQQANVDREFSESVRRSGLTYALEKAGADIRNALAKDPYAFVDEWAEKHKGDFGGDASKARAVYMSDLITGAKINDATLEKLLQGNDMDKVEFERKKKLYSLISPEKEANHQLWQMEFERREGEKRYELLKKQVANYGQGGGSMDDVRWLHQQIANENECLRKLTFERSQKAGGYTQAVNADGTPKTKTVNGVAVPVYEKADTTAFDQEIEAARKRIYDYNKTGSQFAPQYFQDTTIVPRGALQGG